LLRPRFDSEPRSMASSSPVARRPTARVATALSRPPGDRLRRVRVLPPGLVPRRARSGRCGEMGRDGGVMSGSQKTMRLGLVDLLFWIACMAVGMLLGHAVASGLPTRLRPFAGPVAGLFVYLGLVHPLYRGLRLLPMIFPRCPSCRRFQQEFHILGGVWPRVSYRCLSCKGEFIVWHNGAPDDRETWERPVLALKWPYALGRYRRVQRPEPGSAGNG
jgi:hypothetical protein